MGFTTELFLVYISRGCRSQISVTVSSRTTRSADVNRFWNVISHVRLADAGWNAILSWFLVFYILFEEQQKRDIFFHLAVESTEPTTIRVPPHI